MRAFQQFGDDLFQRAVNGHARHWEAGQISGPRALNVFRPAEDTNYTRKL